MQGLRWTLCRFAILEAGIALGQGRRWPFFVYAAIAVVVNPSSRSRSRSRPGGGCTRPPACGWRRITCRGADESAPGRPGALERLREEVPTMREEDLLRLECVADPGVSPDGACRTSGTSAAGPTRGRSHPRSPTTTVEGARYFSSCSISSITVFISLIAALNGADVVMSTPASFSRSIGYLDEPDESMAR